jgi:hypothetical protein
MWAQSTAIDAAIKANPSRGGGAKLRVSLEEVAGLPNSGKGSTMLRPTKHERGRRLSHTVSPFTEGLNITRVLQVKSTNPARRWSEVRNRSGQVLLYNEGSVDFRRVTVYSLA